MSTISKNLSIYDAKSVPDASDLSIGIVISEWNNEITNALLDGAVAVLEKHGVRKENIIIDIVPGSFELTYGAKRIAENQNVDAVIVFGCVIKGETPHFDYVCSSVTQGITQLNIMFDIPFIFGLLTTNTKQQAEDRSGGQYGNKGIDAAITAIKMAVKKHKNIS